MFHSHCIRFLREEKYQPPDYELKPSAPAPDTVCIKDFIRWYIDSSAGRGRVSKNKKPTVRSTCTFAERFFSGFKNATTSEIVQDQVTLLIAWNLGCVRPRIAIIPVR